MIDLTLFAKQDHERISAMWEGGQKLGKIRQELLQTAAVGMTFAQIEERAQELIAQAGAVPSFSTVPGYDWATCVMVNDGLCHGVPTDTVIQDGDVLTVDVGLIWKGYHVDSTGTVIVGTKTPEKEAFLALGRQAEKKSINKVRAGATVYDVANAMENTLKRGGAGVVEQLTGHAIGKELHMAPNIPCKAYPRDKNIKLVLGQTICVEAMYTKGSPRLVVDKDGWTYRTADGSLSAMFEETVLVGPKGPIVLTIPSIHDII